MQLSGGHASFEPWFSGMLLEIIPPQRNHIVKINPHLFGQIYFLLDCTRRGIYQGDIISAGGHLAAW